MNINPKVLDLSHYDDVQDKFAGAVQFGIRGVINKVTEGLNEPDKSYNWRRQPATDAGLLFGAYHFFRPGNVTEQAEWFVRNIGDPTHLQMALDMEVPGLTFADAQAWLQKVYDLTGQWPWLYSYSSYLQERFKDGANPFWKNIGLWLAAYNDHPVWPTTWDKPVLWQYTGDGSGLEPHNVPGIVIEGKGIDINSFDGADEELAAAWAA